MAEGKIIIAVVVGFCCLVARGELGEKAPWNVHELHAQGAMFEDVGTARVYDSTWTVLTKTGIPRWEETLTFLETAEANVTFLSGKIDQQRDHWPREISRRIAEVLTRMEEIEMFVMQIPPVNSRSRRGLVDAGGSLLKFLFGTMDRDDEEEIHAQLKEVEDSQSEYAHVAQQQLTLMRGTANTLGDAISNITDQHNLLIRRVAEIDALYRKASEQAGADRQQLMLRAEFLDLVSFVTIVLQEVESSLNELLNLLTAAGRHEISPVMLPPRKFRALWSEVYRQKNRAMPSVSLAQIATAIRVDFRVEGRDVWLKIQVPVFEETLLSVNRVHLILMSLGNYEWSVLDTGMDYILNSTKSRRVIEYTEANFQRGCNSVNETFYVCKDLQPRQDVQGTVTCLQSLLTPSRFTQGPCCYKHMQPPSDVLVPLKSRNAWLYVVQNPLLLSGHCGENVAEVMVRGMGVIELVKVCEYQLGSYVLPFNLVNSGPLLLRKSLPVQFPVYAEPTNKQIEMTTSLPGLELLDISTFVGKLRNNVAQTENIEKELSSAKRSHEGRVVHWKVDIALIVLLIVVMMMGVMKAHKAWIARRSPAVNVTVASAPSAPPLPPPVGPLPPPPVDKCRHGKPFREPPRE